MKILLGLWAAFSGGCIAAGSILMLKDDFDTGFEFLFLGLIAGALNVTMWIGEDNYERHRRFNQKNS